MGSNLIIGSADEGSNKLLVPVKVDASGHLMIDVQSIAAGNNRIGSVGIEGYINGAWQKAPLPWGASGVWADTVGNTNIPLGVSYLNFNTFPANAFTVITTIAVIYIGTIYGVRIRIEAIWNGAFGTQIAEYRTIDSEAYNIWQGMLVMRPIDTLRAVIINGTAGDDVYLQGNGYYLTYNL